MCLLYQAWDWGGVVLYGMLSVLNLVWFSRIIGMIKRRFARSKASAAAAPSKAAAQVSLKGPAAAGEEDNAADARAEVLASPEDRTRAAQMAEAGEPDQAQSRRARQRSASSRAAKTHGSSQQQQRGSADATAGRPRQPSPERMKRLHAAAAAHGFKVTNMVVKPTMEDLRKAGLL